MQFLWEHYNSLSTIFTILFFELEVYWISALVTAAASFANSVFFGFQQSFIVTCNLQYFLQLHDHTNVVAVM